MRKNILHYNACRKFKDTVLTLLGVIFSSNYIITYIVRFARFTKRNSG